MSTQQLLVSIPICIVIGISLQGLRFYKNINFWWHALLLLVGISISAVCITATMIMATEVAVVNASLCLLGYFGSWPVLAFIRDLKSKTFRCRLRLSIAVDFVEKDEEKSEFKPREFWIIAKLPYPPTVGLCLIDVPGVPFVSIPPITRVFYRYSERRYSCHTETFIYEDVGDYIRSIKRLEENWGTGIPK